MRKLTQCENAALLMDQLPGQLHKIRTAGWRLVVLSHLAGPSHQTRNSNVRH